MKHDRQMSFFGNEATKVNDTDLEVDRMERLMDRIEMAKLCVGHKQNERAVNNLLIVRKEINRLIKKLKTGA